MSVTYWLWIALALNVLAFRWIGRNFISQPRLNWPMLFWNPAMQAVGVIGPFVAFAAIVACGFIWTEQGWWYLGVSAIVIGFFGVRRPRIFE